ncbi:MAG: glucose-1-phosphate adenylyltransferase family protein [Patescibacteria group bacterium]
MDDYVLAFVMAGGRGSRLKILTKHRTKPAVSMLGQYRIFDFVGTNIANSNIPAMIIAAQFEPQSLLKHIGHGKVWGFDGIDKRIEINHPHERDGEMIRFEGTADSVRKSMHRINSHNPRIVLVLGGDHVYAMDYKETIHQHTLNNADVTIMANPIKEEKVSSFGLMKVDETGKVVDFAEKPTDQDVIERFRLSDRIKNSLDIDDEYDFLASMGNYVFFRDRLEKFLDYKGTDFGHHIIPKIKKEGGSVYAYPYRGYWRDVGQVGDYFDCHMDFIGKNTPIDLIKHRVRTTGRHLPGPRIAKTGQVIGSLLSNGDDIAAGSKIINSVLGYQVIVSEKATVKESILLGGDRNQYYRDQLRKYNISFIGKNSNLEKVIFDKNVKVGSNVNISPDFGSPEERRKNLKKIGLKPYRERNGSVEGDFYIDEDRNILVLGKRTSKDKEELTIPDNFQG